MYEKSRVKEYILSQIDYSKASAVLDIGCGRGDDLIEIAGKIGENAKLYGFDTIARSIDSAKTKTDGDPRFLADSFNDEKYVIVIAL